MSATRSAPLVAILLAVGCADPVTLEDYACPEASTPLRYESFGAPFVSLYCHRCHAGTASDRNGAPGEMVFDTREQIVEHRERIFERAAASNDSMPPGPEDPPREERDKLAEWLACGAP